MMSARLVEVGRQLATLRRRRFRSCAAKTLRAFHERNVQTIQRLSTERLASQEKAVSPLLGKPAPSIDLTLLDGREMPWKALQGRIVVLDFWAVWCGPCLRALPKFRELDARYDNGQVAAIGVTKPYRYGWNEARDEIEEDRQASRTDESKAIGKFLAKQGVGFPQVFDDGKIIDAYDMGAWPTMVVIDREGDYPISAGGRRR